MEIDDLLMAHGAEGFLAIALMVREQELQIEFLMRTVGARINGSDPEIGYQTVRADCRTYVATHSGHLKKLREYLSTIEKAREALETKEGDAK
jgi:hypothetical protein